MPPDVAAKSSTDVLQLLASQHAAVDALFEKIEKSEGDRKALLAELADNLAAHATVEEKIFYPAVMAKSTSDKLHESVEEHLQIKRVLADLIAMRPAAIGGETLAMFELMTDHPSKNVPNETKAAASLPPVS